MDRNPCLGSCTPVEAATSVMVSAVNVMRASAQREPVGGVIPSCLQIARASGHAISRWRGTAVERSASKPQ
jgi:tellurite resistance protein